MSNEKTSPGPWTRDGRWVSDSNGAAVAEYRFESDARLGAAAPELLELLRRWNVSIGTIEEIDQLASETTALLKRIDGASCGTCGMEDGHFTDCPIFKARQHCHSCGLIGDQHTDDCGAPR